MIGQKSLTQSKENLVRRYVIVDKASIMNTFEGVNYLQAQTEDVLGPEFICVIVFDEF